MRARSVLLVALMLVPAAAGQSERVAFAERERDVELDGALSEGASVTYEFQIPDANLTSVSFALTWVDDDVAALSGPDTFVLSAEAPGAHLVGMTRSSGGAALVQSPRIQAVPEAAPHAAEANHEGAGTWRATVRLADTGNPSGLPVDRGNPYHLEVRIIRYEAVPLTGAVGGAGYGFLSRRAEPVPLGWGMAIGALLALAAGLAVALVVPRRRSRSPGGDNTTSPRR